MKTVLTASKENRKWFGRMDKRRKNGEKRLRCGENAG
jgi:hypothetical protein